MFLYTGGSEFTGVPPPSTIARWDLNQMTWGLWFLVKWVHNMLGFRASSSQVVLKAFLSLKPSRKVRAVEVPFRGSKHENSTSALKSAIHVKSLLSDLSKLLQGNFYLLSTTLSDLKGGSWFYFLCFRNGRDFGVFVCCLATAPGVAIMGGGRQIL